MTGLNFTEFQNRIIFLMKTIVFCLALLMMVFAGCKKSSDASQPIVTPANFSLITYSVDGVSAPTNAYNVGISPVIKFQFSAAISRQTVSSNIALNDGVSGATIACSVSYQNGDSVVILQPSSVLLMLPLIRSLRLLPILWASSV